MLVWSFRVAIFSFGIKKEDIYIIHTNNKINVRQTTYACTFFNKKKYLRESFIKIPPTIANKLRKIGAGEE